jgi:hypothetical protein
MIDDKESHDAKDVVKEELDEKDLAAVPGGFAPQPEPPAPVLVRSPIGPAKAVAPITGALITGTNKPGLSPTAKRMSSPARARRIETV